MRIDIQNVEGRIVYKKVILGDHPELLHRIIKAVEHYEEMIAKIHVEFKDDKEDANKEAHLAMKGAGLL